MKALRYSCSALMLALIIFSNPYSTISGNAETIKQIQSNQIEQLQLIYHSDAFNEAPFFAADSIVMESGDNQNDHLTLIPFNGFSDDPINYSNPRLFRQLENPRSDVPDSNKLVFSAIGKNGKKGIYFFDKFNSMDFSENITDPKKAPVCLLANNANNWNPSYHSKLGLLAYVSDAAGAPQIFLFNQQTKQSVQLTRLAKALHPSFDANGEWIYFTGVDTSDNYDLYKIRANGTSLTRLTNNPEIEKYPTLTRYGKWLTYERGTKTNRAIWLMSLDGKVQKQISASNHWASTACMNYTGTKITFEGVINGKKGIYLGEIPESIYNGAYAEEFSPGMDVAKELVNLSQFGVFTSQQLQKLSQYGFFVVPTENKQLFMTYEENEYKNIPSFVSADNLMQLLHIIFDTSLRKTEEVTLLPRLSQLSRLLLIEVDKRQNLNQDPQFQALKRYCLVLYQLLNAKPYPNTTLADQTTVNAELAKIKAGQFAPSSVFPDITVDYSLFKVRGHYTTNANLQKYFKAMNYLGLIKLDTRLPAQRRQICLFAELLNASPEIIKHFTTLYQVTAFFAGESNTPNFYQFSALWQQEFKNPIDYRHFDDQKCQLIIEKLFQQHPVRIQNAAAEPTKNNTAVIAVMGARYVADSHLFSLLFKNLGQSYLPGGLDLFAALDNSTARSLLSEMHATQPSFSRFDQALQEIKPTFQNIGATANQPLFNQWISLLKSYANSNEAGAPAVFKTPHWQKKKLTSALASWTELKHDTILYAEQVAAECGGGDEPPKVNGYIEPELTFYQALRQTLITMDHDLQKLNCQGIHRLNDFIELIDFFILVSRKELNHQPLSDQENNQIRIIGGLLEAKTITALDADVRWWEITSESAKNMALVADIFQYWGKYQTEGVGYADDLYIIIPVNHQLYLMRGSIFSHYEFLHPQRATDGEWYELIKTLPLEKRSKWWQNYLDRQKATLPVPADPYDSGC